MNDQENVAVTETEHQSTLPPKITKENIEPISSKKHLFLKWLRPILNTILSSFLISFTAKMLIAPNNFTIGGITGLAILFDVAFGIQQSITLFCCNLPLVLISFFFVQKRFAILSSINIGLQSLWMLLFENCFPHLEIIFPGGETARIFAAVAAGVGIGVSIALAFKAGGSTGGADILAVMIRKKFAATSIAWMLFAINCVVIGSSLLVFYETDPAGNLDLGVTLLPVVLSIFEAYIESKANESITNGFQSAIEFRVITDKPDLMATALMKELSRGVTAIPATGMYTKITHTMLLCVVSRRQIATLRRIMKEIDPDSFAVMANVSQVLGLGFYANEL